MNQGPSELIAALKRMPVPPPEEGFTERVLVRATGRNLPAGSYVARRGWQRAALAAAAVTTVAFILVPRLVERDAPMPGILLAVGEPRDIQVLIGSERALPGASIHVLVTGNIDLVGFGEEHELRWQADLDRGNNLLSLPVVARAPGAGRLEAIVEHEGRIQRIAVDLRANIAGADHENPARREQG